MRMAPLVTVELDAAGAIARGERNGAQRVGERQRAGLAWRDRSVCGITCW